MPPALYDADKKAHEEAVRNGGVSPFNFAYFWLSSFCAAHFVLVRHSGPVYWHEPGDLHLAEPQTRNRSKLTPAPYSRYAARGRGVRNIRSRETCLEEEQRGDKCENRAI